MSISRTRRRSVLVAAALAAAALAVAAPAHAGITVTVLVCQSGTSIGAPPGGYLQFDVTGLAAGTQYAWVAVTPTGQILVGSLLDSVPNFYTGSFFGPLTLVVLPASAVTRDANGTITSYDATAAVFSETVEVPACIESLLPTLSSVGASPGILNSLTVKLTQALDALNSGKKNAVTVACNELNAFVNEVESQQASGQISSSDAAKLIQLATGVQATLGCS